MLSDALWLAQRVGRRFGVGRMVKTGKRHWSCGKSATHDHWQTVGVRSGEHPAVLLVQPAETSQSVLSPQPLFAGLGVSASQFLLLFHFLFHLAFGDDLFINWNLSSGSGRDLSLGLGTE